MGHIWLRNWTKGDRKGLAFAVPMVWSEPKNYLCTIYTKRLLFLCRKKGAEFLVPRLREKDCVDSNVTITSYRNRKQALLPFFSENNDLAYCNNISEFLLMMSLPEYRPIEWRLFLDSSKRSLQCVLLHNRNKFASIPIVHSTNLKEKYENVKVVLEKNSLFSVSVIC